MNTQGTRISAYETVFDLNPPMPLYGINMGAGSVFIPSVHRNVDEIMLFNLLGNTGRVLRIDWSEMTQPKKNFRRAFVHFEMCDQDRIKDTSYIQYCITVNGISNSFSLTILPAQNPVPQTELNIHQLANNLKLLEESMWGAMNAKNEQIHDMEELIDDLRTKMENQEALINILLKRHTYPSPPALVRQTNRPPSFQYDYEEKQFDPKYDLGEAVECTQDEAVPDWVSDAGTESTSASTLPPLEPIDMDDDIVDLQSESSEASMPSLIPNDDAKSVSTHDSMPPLMSIQQIDGIDNWDFHRLDPVVYNSAVNNEDI